MPKTDRHTPHTTTTPHGNNNSNQEYLKEEFYLL